MTQREYDYLSRERDTYRSALHCILTCFYLHPDDMPLAERRDDLIAWVRDNVMARLDAMKAENISLKQENEGLRYTLQALHKHNEVMYLKLQTTPKDRVLAIIGNDGATNQEIQAITGLSKEEVRDMVVDLIISDKIYDPSGLGRWRLKR